MYYEQNPKKKKKKRAPLEPSRPSKRSAFKAIEEPKKKKHTGCLTGLFKCAFGLLIATLVLMLLSGIWVRLNFLSGNRSGLAVNKALPGSYTHVLLLGADEKKDENRSRTDSIMVASFGQGGDLKFTSLMRDTMIQMGEYGNHKLNAAYRIGGGDLAMYAVNSAFGMNITKYATIDFEGIAKVIDAMGGIELDITEAERDQINEGLKNAYKKQRVFNGVLMQPLTQFGKQVHMSGTHALFYARIRSIDSDFERARRQRTLLSTMMNRLKRNPNPITLGRVLTAGLQCLQTNLSAADLMALGMRALSTGGEIEQFRLPQEGAYKQGTVNGTWRITANFDKCKAAFYEFIYG